MNTTTTILKPATPNPTDDQVLWVAIRNRTEAISFNKYKDFIDDVFCLNNFDDVRAAASSQSDSKEQVLAKPIAADSEDAGVSSSLRHNAKRKTRATRHLREHQEKLRAQTLGKFHGNGAYDLLKLATETLLLIQCGVNIDYEQLDRTDEMSRLSLNEDANFDLEAYLTTTLKQYLVGDPAMLPYFERVVSAAFSSLSYTDSPFCDGLLISNVTCPCLLELIWCFWTEAGGSPAAMKAISNRFQNLRTQPGKDPLAHMEIAPLRPIMPVLWGYVSDEMHRIPANRREAEYMHEYALDLQAGSNRPPIAVDIRTNFIESFHVLLNTAVRYYRDASDATVIPDSFDLLNAAKDVHLKLSAGAHNGYRDLPFQLRVEMLMKQWILGRQEIRDFLPTRPMVPVAEAWMGQADTMNKLQGWGIPEVRYFRDLAQYGERIVLSLRFGHWSDATNEDQAKNWANYFRQDIRAYIHAYRMVTGVDLGNNLSDPESARLTNTQPISLIRQRVTAQA